MRSKSIIQIHKDNFEIEKHKYLKRLKDVFQDLTTLKNTVLLRSGAPAPPRSVRPTGWSAAVCHRHSSLSDLDKINMRRINQRFNVI